MNDRRTLISRAAVSVIDTHGARALTHRRVDSAAGLPSGTTSYYAPTRKDLLGLAVDAIASHPDLQPSEQKPPAQPGTVEEAVELLTAGIARAAQAGPAIRARSAILPEVLEWPEIAGRLLESSPSAQDRRLEALAILTGIGAADPEGAASELVALCEALLIYLVTRPGELDTAQILRPYLIGLGGRG